MENYDLIILGTGAAGLPAGMYAGRYRLKTLVIGKDPGALATAHLIENWPGEKSIPGVELIKKFEEHVKAVGTEVLHDEITSLAKSNGGFEVGVKSGEKYQSKSLIISIGTQRRKLNVPGEEEFLGKGVSYCATCDAPFFKDKDVAVIGGGDAGCTAGLLVAQYAKKVYILEAGPEIKPEPITKERLDKEPKIEVIVNVQVQHIKGSQTVEGLVLNKEVNGKNELAVQGVLIEIGAVPSAALLKGIGVETDDKGYVKIKAGGATNVEGVFAAGDIAVPSEGKTFRQGITAAAEGAIAATSAYNWLRNK